VEILRIVKHLYIKFIILIIFIFLKINLIYFANIVKKFMQIKNIFYPLYL
jgi:hypothetical protein